MTKIPRTPVTSSQIVSLGHSPATNELDIEFKPWGGKTHRTGEPEKPNSVYRYQNFTAPQFAAFMAAESKGKWFGGNVKKETAKHPYKKLSPEEAAQ